MTCRNLEFCPTCDECKNCKCKCDPPDSKLEARLKHIEARIAELESAQPALDPPPAGMFAEVPCEFCSEYPSDCECRAILVEPGSLEWAFASVLAGWEVGHIFGHTASPGIVASFAVVEDVEIYRTGWTRRRAK